MGEYVCGGVCTSFRCTTSIRIQLKMNKKQKNMSKKYL